MESPQNRPISHTASKTRVAGHRLPPRATIAKLAEVCGSIAEADTRLILDEPLTQILKREDSLRSAWQRGRLIRHVKALAAAGATLGQAASSLGMVARELAGVIEADVDVKDAWQEGRLSFVCGIAAVNAERAVDGETDAIRNLERAVREEISRARLDTKSLTLSGVELAAMVGASRQTVSYWHRVGGLTQASPGRYAVQDFVAWFSHRAWKRTGGRRAFKQTGGAMLQEREKGI